MPVTIKDISEATGFAPSTISHILNDRPGCRASKETREKIKGTARKLGYAPDYFARGLRKGRSYTVGIVGGIFGHEVFSHQIQGLSKALLKRGFQPAFLDNDGTQENEDECVRSMCRRSVEGLILSWPLDAARIREMAPAHIPCVLLSDHVGPGCSCIVIDRAAAVRSAMEMLLESGHRRIGMVVHAFHTNRQTCEGYRGALMERGLLDAGLMWEAPPGETGAFVARHLDAIRSLSAIVCGCDATAIELMSALSRAGVRVPQDCSVVGCDDIQLAAHVAPALTTLRQPQESIGELAVELFNVLKEGGPPRNVLLVPELVVRESSGPCAGPVS